ncbi:MAG: hypothetical protein JNL10_01590 [Verrucomicrobiales bacterium]|nr:hypothetical protein [Verrucomicrobiales bacterium]
MSSFWSAPSPPDVLVVRFNSTVPAILVRCLASFLGLALSCPLFLQALEPQTLTWHSPTNPILRLNIPYELQVTASSGLPISYRILDGPASIQEDRLVITSVAPVTVVADQVGNETYRPRSITNRFNTNSVTRLNPLGRVSHAASANRVRIQGGLAFVGEGSNGLQIFDVSQPEAPVRVGGIVTGGIVAGLQVRGNYAYLAENDDGLRVVDISNPAQPFLLGICDTPGSAQDLDVVDAVAYVADSSGGLQIIDVRDPANPTRVGEYVPSGAVLGVCVANSVAYISDSRTGLHILDVSVPTAPTPISTFGGGPARAVALDPTGRLALICGNDGFRLLNVSVPSAPVLLGGGTGLAALRGRVFNGLVHVITGNRLRVYSIENGTLVSQLSQPVTEGTPLDVALSGTSAFVASGSGGLEVFNVRRGFRQTIRLPPDALPVSFPFVFTNAPLTLKASASSELPVRFVVERGPAVVEGNILRLTGTGPISLRAEQPGDDLFFPAPPQTFVALVQPNQAITLDSPTNRVLALRTTHELRATATGGGPLTSRVLSGPGVIDGTRLTISAVDPVVIVTEQAGDAVFQPVAITNVFNSQFEVTGKLLSTVPLPGKPRRLDLADSMALIATEEAGVQIVDVGDPARPVHLGEFNTEGEAKSVQVVDRIAFVADGTAGLRIIDVRDPVSPKPLGGIDTPGDAQDVRVFEDLAYVADGESGLQIIDVRSPTNPVRVGSYYFSGSTRAVEVVGSLAYALGVFSGLEILDVRDPANPLRIGKQSLPEVSMPPRQALQVIGSTAYLADGSSRLRTLNVNPPTAPGQLGIDPGNLPSFALNVVGLTAYVVGGERLDAYDVHIPEAIAGAHLGGIVVGGEASDIRIRGLNAFVVNRASGLQVIRLQKRLPQTVDFSLPQVLNLAGSPLTLNGSSTSGLPLRYRVNQGPAQLVGDQLILTGSGFLEIEAVQLGDEDYQPAPSVRVWATVTLPPPGLSATASREGNTLQLTLHGTPGVQVRLERSTDLGETAIWETVVRLKLGETPVQVDEELELTGLRFYRAVEVE